MNKLVFVFPGQGAHKPGMGQALYEASPRARQLMEQANRLMPGLLDTCFQGPMESLTRTDIAQPALFMVEAALFEAAKEAGFAPQAVAGFSLGEWSACYAAGMFDFETGFLLVKNRGAWMQASADKSPGGMAAVLRLSADEVREKLKGHPQVQAVNFNAPGQTVVAGLLPALEAFERDLKARGGRSMRLNVAGAFHSSLMASASEKMAGMLAETNFHPPQLPVISNLTAQPYEAETAKDWLARQLASPVLWEESIRRLAAQGFDRFLELGPGKVLSGLISKIWPEAQVLQAEDMAGIAQAMGAFGGNV